MNILKPVLSCVAPVLLSGCVSLTTCEHLFNGDYGARPKHKAMYLNERSGNCTYNSNFASIEEAKASVYNDCTRLNGPGCALWAVDDNWSDYAIAREHDFEDRARKMEEASLAVIAATPSIVSAVSASSGGTAPPIAPPIYPAAPTGSPTQQWAVPSIETTGPNASQHESPAFAYAPNLSSCLSLPSTNSVGDLVQLQNSCPQRLEVSYCYGIRQPAKCMRVLGPGRTTVPAHGSTTFVRDSKDKEFELVAYACDAELPNCIQTLREFSEMLKKN